MFDVTTLKQQLWPHVSKLCHFSLESFVERDFFPQDLFQSIFVVSTVSVSIFSPHFCNTLISSYIALNNGLIQRVFRIENFRNFQCNQHHRVWNRWRKPHQKLLIILLNNNTTWIILLFFSHLKKKSGKRFMEL